MYSFIFRDLSRMDMVFKQCFLPIYYYTFKHVFLFIKKNLKIERFIEYLMSND